jgi:hypothetical protein
MPDDDPLASGDDEIRRQHREAVRLRFRGWPAPEPKHRQDVLDWLEDWLDEFREQAAQGKELWLRIPNITLFETIFTMAREGAVFGEGRGGQRRRRTSYKYRLAVKNAAAWGYKCKLEEEARGESKLNAMDIASEKACEYLRENSGISLRSSYMQQQIVAFAAVMRAAGAAGWV